MQKFFLAAFTGIFLLLVTGIAANGQLDNANIPSSGDILFSNNSGIVDRSNINSRLVKNFVRSYKNVSNEKWFEVNDGFVAMFHLDDIVYQVAYDKKGKWFSTIRSYGEAKLRQDLRHTIKSIYYDYDINLVQEIEKPVDPITYIIQLVGKTELINLKVSDGEMVVWKKFNKSE